MLVEGFRSSRVEVSPLKAVIQTSAGFQLISCADRLRVLGDDVEVLRLKPGRTGGDDADYEIIAVCRKGEFTSVSLIDPVDDGYPSKVSGFKGSYI